MGIASYNRGSWAISEHITQTLKESRHTAPTVPALPVGWSVTYCVNWIEVRDQSETLVHREPIAFRQSPSLNRACQRAQDPCLRNTTVGRDGGHALNGWQLHY